MNRSLNELNRTGLEADSKGNPLAHWLLWSIALFVSIALLWANYATLDEVTRATGRVIPSSQIQTIQNLEGGILREINVNVGDQVKKARHCYVSTTPASIRRSKRTKRQSTH